MDSIISKRINRLSINVGLYSPGTITYHDNNNTTNVTYTDIFYAGSTQYTIIEQDYENMPYYELIFKTDMFEVLVREYCHPHNLTFDSEVTILHGKETDILASFIIISLQYPEMFDD